MSCPACGAPRVAGQERCGGCGALLAPPVEGALAPSHAPPRDAPGLRRRVERDKTWKDEVRDRVRHRKQEKARDRGKGQELPLFRDGVADPVDAQEERPEPVTEPAPPLISLGEPRPEGPGSVDPYALTERIDPGPEVDDLPLNIAPYPEPVEIPRTLPEPMREEAREEWSLDAPETRVEPPVERPAFVGERARAAAVDIGFLAALWAVVVYFAYFAGRGAASGTAQLLRTWPWLVGYLAFLGLTYAAYFTGTTGQTLGKILGGLRVVDTAGRPPGYLRSFVRAGIGGIGLLLAGLGAATMFVDPARRAFHDKLLGTRVVRK